MIEIVVGEWKDKETLKLEHCNAERNGMVKLNACFINKLETF